MVAADTYFLGISGGSLPVDQFDLGHGVSLRRTYAHLMSPCLMAFSPAERGKAHPAPWRTANGGFSFDVTIELRVEGGPKPGGLDPQGAASWIMALLRLGYAPYLSAPVKIDMPFSEAAHSVRNPTITQFEVQEPNFYKSVERSDELPLAELEWLRETWPLSADLGRKYPKFLTAVQAYDNCRQRTRVSQTLLIIWGALEQLFAPSPGELRHRVAANLAAYLEPRGADRLDTYKHILKLYNVRSDAAHSSKEVEHSSMIESWVILRNSLVKMIEENQVPSQTDFENLLYADLSPVDADRRSWRGRSKAPE